ncbi:hypothetical protein TRIATDRAFT_299234 [Trichoderma atroviride IMI 206040]|uniref:Uncharacterized protein n=1 Tax=Hypocrea atroviridis (strain ATCC 20476 / IMI 206040) TaxID=452589 RepID=G9NRT0_HYPAI|nr:uncharacterized protein TRIATDRAFT_299234 [Trichoderma atroviride IMI 206040]EHK46712.1 hypothetical protein TRIATDRAFT_299234 [Trichoderma atroviride IMI 206040]
MCLFFQKLTQYKHPRHHHICYVQNRQSPPINRPVYSRQVSSLPTMVLSSSPNYLKLPTNPFGLLHRSSLFTPTRLCHACESLTFFFSPTTSCPSEIPTPSEPH